MTTRARYPRMYWYKMITTVLMLAAILPREDTTALVIRDITEMERIVNQVRWQALYQLGRFLKSYVSRQYRLICAKSRQFIWPLFYDGQVTVQYQAIPHWKGKRIPFRKKIFRSQETHIIPPQKN